nr:ribosomal protein S7 [Lithodesmioides sp. mgcode 4]
MTNSIVIRFINKLTLKGKKFKSYKIFKNSIKYIQKKTKKNHKKLFQFSLINISPLFNLKSIKKKRKKSTEFPFFIKSNLRISLAIKFILEKRRSSNTILNKEIISIMKNHSNIFQKKKTLNEFSFNQKKYANYRWF